MRRQCKRAVEIIHHHNFRVEPSAAKSDAINGLPVPLPLLISNPASGRTANGFTTRWSHPGPIWSDLLVTDARFGGRRAESKGRCFGERNRSLRLVVTVVGMPVDRSLAGW